MDTFGGNDPFADSWSNASTSASAQLKDSHSGTACYLSVDRSAQGSNQSLPSTTTKSERNNEKELCSLHAQLESQRFMKKFVQKKNKEYEEKIASLMKDNERLQLEVQKSKSEILGKSEDEQVSRGVEQMKELTEIIGNSTEKNILKKKLEIAEKNTEKETNNELEQFIQDSSETDISDNESTSENLGSSVVDVLLHEKIEENMVLREELNNLKKYIQEMSVNSQKLPNAVMLQEETHDLGNKSELLSNNNFEVITQSQGTEKEPHNMTKTKEDSERYLEHEHTLNTVEDNLRLAKELIQKKDSELQAVIVERSELKNKLIDNANLLEREKGNYTKIEATLQNIEDTIEELFNVNKQMHKEFVTIRRTFKAASQCFEAADRTIRALSDQLLKEKKTNTKLNEQLIEAGEKLEGMLKEKTDIINCQNDKLLALEEQIVNWNELCALLECEQSRPAKSISLEITLLKQNQDLIIENNKFREIQKANKKIIETLALKLGDTQVLCTENKQEKHDLFENLEVKKSLVEELQKEKTICLSQLSMLKQCLDEASEATKVRQILEENNVLIEKNKKLEASEWDYKSKLVKCEQIGKSKDEQIRGINFSLEIAEGTILRLNQDIRAINFEQSALKSTHNKQVKKLTKERDDTLEELRREKLSNRVEILQLKERLKSVTGSEVHLNNQLRNLVQMNSYLAERKEILETAEFDAKVNVQKLEKLRKSNESQIRELRQSLETMERKNVHLFHEIGAANSQLCKMKELRDTALARAGEFEKMTEECLAFMENLRNENMRLRGQLSKVVSDLKAENDFLSKELSDLQFEFVALKEQKEQFEKEHNMTIAKLNDSEMEKARLLSENKDNQSIFEGTIEQFICEVNGKREQISHLRTEQESLWERTEAQNLEIENLTRRLLAAETNAESEEWTSMRLKMNFRALKAKYKKVKQQKHAARVKIRKLRLEMKHKLRVMQNKMDEIRQHEKNWMICIIGLALLTICTYFSNYFMSGFREEPVLPLSN